MKHVSLAIVILAALLCVSGHVSAQDYHAVIYEYGIYDTEQQTEIYESNNAKENISRYSYVLVELTQDVHLIDKATFGFKYM